MWLMRLCFRNKSVYILLTQKTMEIISVELYGTERSSSWRGLTNVGVSPLKLGNGTNTMVNGTSGGLSPGCPLSF